MKNNEVFNVKKLIQLALAATLLAGCKVDTEIDLYTTDLLSLTKGDVLTTPSLIRIEVSGCEKNKNRIMGIASKYFDVSSEAACLNKSAEEFVEFSAQSPVIYDSNFLPKNLVAGVSVVADENGRRAVYVVIDKTRFSAMENDVKDMDSTASLELNAIIINLNHDGRDEITAYIPAAFVNNNPMIGSTAKLKRRENATIRISNVGVAQAAKDGTALVFEIN